jgi:hypothetical protein
MDIEVTLLTSKLVNTIEVEWPKRMNFIDRQEAWLTINQTRDLKNWNIRQQFAAKL